jgi:hypothetical protein
MNNLSKTMQERLDTWRKNHIRVPSAEKLKRDMSAKTNMPSYVARSGAGDDDDDVMRAQQKDKMAWQKEVENNPNMYRR